MELLVAIIGLFLGWIVGATFPLWWDAVLNCWYRYTGRGPSECGYPGCHRKIVGFFVSHIEKRANFYCATHLMQRKVECLDALKESHAQYVLPTTEDRR